MADGAVYTLGHVGGRVDVARIGVEGFETRPSQAARRIRGVGASSPGPMGIETSQSSRVKRQLRLAVFDFIRPIGWSARRVCLSEVLFCGSRGAHARSLRAACACSK
jgi:hypothetical protein